MLELTEFDLHKLYGLINLSLDKYEEALDEFDIALHIKEEPSLYVSVADTYIYLRDYKTAQLYILKAINAGYDAYGNYYTVTTRNLADINSAVRVLKEGANKKSPAACFALAALHSDNVKEPDMIDPFECAKYLELGYEYTKPAEKGSVAMAIFHTYKYLERCYPYFVKYSKAIDYLKIASEYGNPYSSIRFINIRLFNEGVEKNDYSVIDLLFKKFDIDSKIVFLFMLLDKEYKETNSTSIDKNSIIYEFITHLAFKEKHIIGKLLKSYIDFVGTNLMQKIYSKFKTTDYSVPDCYRNAFNLFLESYLNVMNEKGEA